MRCPATRRNFLLGSAITTTAPALPAENRASDAVPEPGPRLGCVTQRLLKDYDVETIIRVLETTGYEAVVLREEHRHGVEPPIGQAQRTRVRKSFEASKVRLAGFATLCAFHSPDAAERRRQIERGKQWIDLARDTGAMGVKCRPNGLVEGVPREVTIQNIAASLRELGDYAEPLGVEVWVEISGPGTEQPQTMAAIMRATRHRMVGVGWNSNQADIVDGSVAQSFQILKPWLKTVDLKGLIDLPYPYPWHEFFALLRASGYKRYTFCKADENPQTERFLRWYKALWTEYSRPCTGGGDK